MASATNVLNIVTPGGGLQYSRPPARPLRHGVMVKIVDEVFGDGAAASGEGNVADRYVNVGDRDGNRVPITMQAVWDAILGFFSDDGDAEEHVAGVVVDGTMSLFALGTEPGTRATAKRTRQGSDPAVKVRAFVLPESLCT